MASFGSGLAHTARTINLRGHIRERRFVDGAAQITNRESKSSIEHLAVNRRSANSGYQLSTRTTCPR